MGLWSYGGCHYAEAPKIVDKLTPAGKIDPVADNQQRLAILLPSLLQKLAGASRRATNQLRRSGVKIYGLLM